MNAEEMLGAARLLVRSRTPYFRPALLVLIPKVIEGMGTIGVDRRGVLAYDPVFIEKQTVEQIAGLLVHELMHLLGRHMQRFDAMCHDPRMHNCAGDLAINPAVQEMGFQLPQGEFAGLFPKNFGWDEGLSLDEYYALILAQQQDGEEGDGNGEGQGQGEGQGRGRSGKGKPGDKKQQGKGGGGKLPGDEDAGVARGKCGGCAGNPHAHEPKPGEGGEGGEGKEPCQGDGKNDAEGDGEGRTEAQLARMERQVAEAIQQHVKSRGTVPGSLARWADAALEPPKVPWRQKLGYAARRAATYKAGAVVQRWDGPSRRQTAIGGYAQGVPILPRLRAPIPNVTIIGDTSGSMGPNDLKTVLVEARGVIKALGGGVTFCACDAQVHGVKLCEKIEDIVAMLHGGGGTSMIPALEAVMMQKVKPDLIIVATDGYVGDVGPEPKGVKVIWVITNDQVKTMPWGEVLNAVD